MCRQISSKWSIRQTLLFLLFPRELLCKSLSSKYCKKPGENIFIFILIQLDHQTYRKDRRDDFPVFRTMYFGGLIA
uniref:Secreted protein n=1 Tax=Strigamia maritima TaxID=126957 RepID=T1JJF7_STRMM